MVTDHGFRNGVKIKRGCTRLRRGAHLLQRNTYNAASGLHCVKFFCRLSGNAASSECHGVLRGFVETSISKKRKAGETTGLI